MAIAIPSVSYRTPITSTGINSGFASLGNEINRIGGLVDGTVTNPFVRADGSGNASVSGTFTVGSTLTVYGSANIAGTLTALAGISSRRPAGGTNNDLQVTDSTGSTVLFGVGPNARGPGASGFYVNEPAFLAGSTTIGFGSNGLTVNAGLTLNLAANLMMGTGAFSTGSISFNGATGNGYLPNILTVAGGGNALNLPSATSVTMPNATLTAAGIAFTVRGAVDISALAPFTLTVVSGLQLRVAVGDTTTTGGVPFTFVSQTLTLTATGAVQYAGVYITDSNALGVQYAANESAVPPSSAMLGRLLYIIYLPANANALAAQTTNPGGTTGYIIWDGRLAGNGSGTSGGGGFVALGNVRPGTGNATLFDASKQSVSPNIIAQTNPTSTGTLVIDGTISPVFVSVNGVWTVTTTRITSGTATGGAGFYNWVLDVTTGVLTHNLTLSNTLTVTQMKAGTVFYDGANLYWNGPGYAADLSPLTGTISSSAYKPITVQSPDADTGGGIGALSYAQVPNSTPVSFTLPVPMRYRIDFEGLVVGPNPAAANFYVNIWIDGAIPPGNHLITSGDVPPGAYASRSAFASRKGATGPLLAAGPHTITLVAYTTATPTTSGAFFNPVVVADFHV